MAVGFDADDVSTLISAIDSSQASQASSLPHLPAELLLHILEYVPVDYILDWRQVCRGFRDAIDGRILYHHVQRTQLIGFMDADGGYYIEHSTDEDYERLRLVRAKFARMADGSHGTPGTTRADPIWGFKHALFVIDESWQQTFRRLSGTSGKDGNTIEVVDTRWQEIISKLECRAEEGFGTQRWCIKLDHAVLDLDFPLTAARKTFDVTVDLSDGTVKVAWKDMLFRFLKTERKLRRTMEEVTRSLRSVSHELTHAQKRNSLFTFSHTEDCLRHVRRQRLHAALNPNNKVDRHIKWSLRLLRPLFGKPRHDTTLSLEEIENSAVIKLLLLRREAAMTTQQLTYLHQLCKDHQVMRHQMQELDKSFKDFQSHITGLPSYSHWLPSDNILPCNPVAWPEDLIVSVEERVKRWKSQRNTVKQMHALLCTSNEALTVPEDSFDDLDNDF
jgi:hypothetical protein